MSKFSMFAKLVRNRARAEEDDPKDPTTEEEDQDNSAEDPDQDAEDPEEQSGRAKSKKTKAKRARAEEDDPDAEGDDDPDAEEGDDETDAEDEDDETTAKARARERGRCAAIFATKAATGNLPQAFKLAFETKIPRSEAIAILKAGGIAKPAPQKTSRTALYDRRMTQSRQSLGMDVPQPSQLQNKNKSAAASILQAGMVTGAVKKDFKL